MVKMRSLFAFCALTLFSTSGVTAQSPRPNLIVIMADDLGYSDVGFNGATDIKTPALDRLAQGGTICTAAYVTHPFCGPSRMGLMSGRYPHEIGAPYNLPNSGMGIEDYNKQGIDVHETLISKTLQKAGYHTGAIGKWHMGIEPEFHPNARGFDQFYGFLGGGHQYFPEQYRPIYERQLRAGKHPINDYLLPLEHNGEEVRETEYITDALSREAVRFVKGSTGKDQPFFLYLAYNAPHSPLEAKAEDLKKYTNIKDKKRRTYAAMVHAVDRGVGEIVNALKDVNEFDDTLIAFLSDNGGKLSLGATNRPLKEGKGSVCEGGHRVPMFFHWPQNIPAGKRFDYPVSTLDFYPTFARLAQAEVPVGKQLAGIDIWEDLVAGRNPRQDEMIFVLHHRDGLSDVGARKGQWKIRRTGNTPWKLFNIADDMTESNDLSGQHPERLKRMVAEAELWSRRHTTPRWYDSKKAEANWKKAGMPKYVDTFKVD